MVARNFIGSALLTAGMLMTGGADASVAASEPGPVTTREDARPGQDHEYTYYSDPGMTDIVGGMGRARGAWFRWGTTSAYFDYTSGT